MKAEGVTAVTNGPTEIRLKALVRQAGIRDTLGLVSDDLYQRVIREFPSRPEAAVAQRKLAARQTATPGPILQQTLTPIRTGTAVYAAQLDGARGQIQQGGDLLTVETLATRLEVGFCQALLACQEHRPFLSSKAIREGIYYESRIRLQAISENK